MAYLQHLILVFWASEARKVVLLGCACSIWQHIQLRLLSLMHYFGGKLPSTVVGDTVLYNWVYSRQTFFFLKDIIAAWFAPCLAAWKLKKNKQRKFFNNRFFVYFFNISQLICNNFQLIFKEQYFNGNTTRQCCLCCGLNMASTQGRADEEINLDLFGMFLNH